jgi:GT2 family glycosyltransferase
MADAEPALSVVIPTRATRDLTLRCLESVAASGLDPEVVVVEDACPQATADAVEQRHPTARVFRNETCQGFSRTSNRGLRLARGRVLFLLNSDTEVDRETLPLLLAAFAESPRLGVAGASLHYPDGSPQWSGGRAPTASWLFALSSGLPTLLSALPGYRRARPLEAIREVDWVSGAAMAIRRETWEAIGPLDEAFAFYCQDMEYGLRARAAGWEVRVVPGVRVLHHHGASVGKTRGAFRSRERPNLLWSDLVRLAGKQGGAAAARKTAATLRLGGRLRVLSRSVALPLVPADRRTAWREDTESLRGALAALASLAPARPDEAT